MARSLLGKPAKSTPDRLDFGSKKGSLAITIRGDLAGQGYDFATNEKVSLLDIIAQRNGLKLEGDEFWRVIEIAEDMLGLQHIDPRLPQPPRQRTKFDKRPPLTVVETEPIQQGPTSEDIEDAVIHNHLVALRIWNEAKPLMSSPPVERFYKRHRKIPIRHLGNLDHVLRWSPDECAIIALVTDIETDEPLGILRTYLSTITADRIERMALGPCEGGVIRLSPDNHLNGGLVVGEGVETCLAAMVMGYVPCWAAGSAGRLSNFPVVAGVGELTILVDRDEGGTGQRAAIECANRWKDAGRKVNFVMTDCMGDINDILIKKRGEIQEYE
jgi:hypothetical protein